MNLHLKPETIAAMDARDKELDGMSNENWEAYMELFAAKLSKKQGLGISGRLLFRLWRKIDLRRTA